MSSATTVTQVRQAVRRIEKESESLMHIAAQTDSEEILHYLADNPDWSIRMQVAENRNTPDDILRVLADDDDGDVKAMACVQLALREKLVINS